MKTPANDNGDFDPYHGHASTDGCAAGIERPQILGSSPAAPIERK